MKMEQREKPWGGLAPSGAELVVRTVRSPEQVRKWYFLRAKEKDYHSIGRTVPSLRPFVSQEMVDQVVHQYGCANEIDNLSVTQQLDFLATEILKKDRQLYVRVTGERQRLRYSYLSAWQWGDRRRHETCFPDIEALVALMENPKFRVHNYQYRITRLPFDKHGNLPYVWSRSPQRVGKEAGWGERLAAGDDEDGLLNMDFER